ncbi:hypothetical protein C8Q79DRAFT_1014007 [Trametes meyenii]|nr:hypothetical protein C8Q79DRAFT_1014007 [Trametes meyenii]
MDDVYGFRAPAVRDIIFPEHLRLRPGNWENYKHAVEITCRLHLVDQHLTTGAFTRRPSEGVDWLQESELCKAIIVFNADNFAALGIETNDFAGNIWESLGKKMRAMMW